MGIKDLGGEIPPTLYKLVSIFEAIVMVTESNF